jgi:toxin ParE1/3/4
MPENDYNVFLLKEAEDDIEAILSYAAENGSIEDTLHLMQKIRERIDTLKIFPHRGNVPKELEAVGSYDYRQVIVSPFRLFYRVLDNDVFVALIADGRRDMEELLRRRLMSG